MNSSQLIIWLALCAPGIVPAAYLYARHCNRTPRGENRFPLVLYVVVLLLCAFVAFWAGFGWSVAYACRGPSPGNLCGLLGFVVGPLSSLITVTVVSWLMTHYSLQMKRIAPVAIILVLLGGYYYVDQRGASLHKAGQSSDVIRYSLQSDSVDDLRRYAPVIEAQLRELVVVTDVSLDSQLKSEQAVVGVDPQKPGVPIVKQLPTMTITFSLAPNVTLRGAIAQIREMETRLALPTTIKTSLAGGK
jgi:hypothetical protein